MYAIRSYYEQALLRLVLFRHAVEDFFQLKSSHFMDAISLGHQSINLNELTLFV